MTPLQKEVMEASFTCECFYLFACVRVNLSTFEVVGGYAPFYVYGCSQPYVGRVGTLFFLRLSCQRVYKKG
jgi:hypothetical protein